MDAARVLTLKAEAKALKESTRIKHVAALEIVAQAQGYRTWADLLADVDGAAETGGAAAVRQAQRQEFEPTEAKARRAARRDRYGP